MIKIVQIKNSHKFNVSNLCRRNRESGNVEYKRKNKFGVEKHRNIIQFYRLIFGLGIETDQQTQFLQIYKLPQGISIPGLMQKKREVVHLSYDAPAMASRLTITTIRTNIPPKTKSFCLSVTPF